MVDPLPPGSCLNCGAPLAEPRPRFCGACGQETNVKPPTLGEFLQQFGGALNDQDRRYAARVLAEKQRLEQAALRLRANAA